MAKQKFQIQGMSCVGCAMTIDDAVENLPGVRSASTNYARQIAEVEFDEKKVNTQAIIKAIAEAGYQAAEKN